MRTIPTYIPIAKLPEQRPSSNKKSSKNLSLYGKNNLLKFNEINITPIPTGPWNDFSYFISSMVFLNNQDDTLYHRKMIGWFIEIYQGKKVLSTSIIVAFPNDNSEEDTGINQILSQMTIYIKNSITYYK